jgi:hypothetical protein
MEDKDFDRIFGHKFGQIPNKPPLEKGWEDLTFRLDSDEKKPNKWLLPLLFSTIGLLLCSNVYWWQMSANQTAAVDSKQAVQAQNTAIGSDFQPETIIHDTIYLIAESVTKPKNTIDRHELLQLVAQEVQIQLQGQAKTAQIEESTYKDSPILTNAEPKPVEAKTFVASSIFADTVFENTSQIIEQAVIESNPKSDSLATVLNQESEDQSPFETPETVINRPKRPMPLRLGGCLGLTSSTDFRHDDIEPIGVAGLTVETDFWGGRIALEAQLQYQRGKLKDTNTALIESFTAIPDLGAGFTLKQWSAEHFSSLAYDVQGRYIFARNSKTRPYIGLGGRVVTTLPFEVQFEFENDSNQEEKIESHVKKTQTYWQGLTTSIGIDRDLGRQWLVRAEAQSIWPTQPTDNRIFQQHWGFKTKFLYTF